MVCGLREKAVQVCFLWPGTCSGLFSRLLALTFENFTGFRIEESPWSGVQFLIWKSKGALIVYCRTGSTSISKKIWERAVFHKLVVASVPSSSSVTRFTQLQRSQVNSCSGCRPVVILNRCRPMLFMGQTSTYLHELAAMPSQGGQLSSMLWSPAANTRRCFCDEDLCSSRT